MGADILSSEACGRSVKAINFPGGSSSGVMSSPRLRVDDCQHIAGERSPDEKVVTFDDDNSVPLVED
jgi:hypothetical protein